MDWPYLCRTPAFHQKMEKGCKRLLRVHIACLGSHIWMLGLVPHSNSVFIWMSYVGQISTLYLPLPSRREECQDRWCFTPGWWQGVLFYLPMPHGFQNIERNHGELMHPGKCWASMEAHFYNCQKMKSAEVHWEDSRGRQQLCWVGTSWGNPLGGIRVVDSSPFFLGHMLGAGP